MSTDPRPSHINFPTEDEERIATDKEAERIAALSINADFRQVPRSGFVTWKLCRRVVELKAEVIRLRRDTIPKNESNRYE